MAAITLAVSNVLEIKPPRTRPISGLSPASSRARHTFGGISTEFKMLTPAQKSGWQGAANSLNLSLGRTGLRRFTAANAFKTFAMGRMAIGLPPQSEAPPWDRLGLPPPLPQIAVSASAAEGQFALTLTPRSGTADNPVLVLACAPQIAGKLSWGDKLFAPIGAIRTLGPGPADITALYVAKYGVPQAGHEIVLRLVSVSEAGRRSVGVIVTAVCTDTACQEDATRENTEMDPPADTETDNHAYHDSPKFGEPDEERGPLPRFVCGKQPMGHTLYCSPDLARGGHLNGAGGPQQKKPRFAMKRGP